MTEPQDNPSSPDAPRPGESTPSPQPPAEGAGTPADSPPQADAPQAPEAPEVPAGPAPAENKPSLDAQLEQEIQDALGGSSVEELMEKASAPAAAPTAGTGVVRGRVMAIHGENVFVDVGQTMQGLLPLGQFRDEPTPSVGDEVEVLIERVDEQEGLIRLSRQGAVQAAAWETLETGQVVEGRVTGMNKGGLELRINRLRAFMPLSQIDIGRVDDPEPYLNQTLQCVVTDLDRKEKNLVVSRRKLLEQQAAEMAEKTWQTLEEGQVISGTVRRIMPYGAFVDVGGVDGLLHIKDMSHGHVDDARAVVQEGQTVEVKVLSVDREKERISLGLKQIQADPWEGVEGRYPVDSAVTGRVTKLMDFGAFVELEPGVEGLIPIGEMTYGRRIGHPKEVLSPGDTVKVRVIKVEPARQRISLSLKRMGEDPWQGASVRWEPGSVHEGRVSRIAEFGAFVELSEGVEGLVHISELSSEHVKTVDQVVREGDRVTVKVLDVDESKHRIGLSIKKALDDPTDAQPAVEEAPPPPSKKRNRPLKGGLDSGGLGDLKDLL
jgi:small subunit ribosomal protein S1